MCIRGLLLLMMGIDIWHWHWHWSLIFDIDIWHWHWHWHWHWLDIGIWYKYLINFSGCALGVCYCWWWTLNYVGIHGGPHARGPASRRCRRTLALAASEGGGHRVRVHERGAHNEFLWTPLNWIQSSIHEPKLQYTGSYPSWFRLVQQTGQAI